MQLTGAQRAAIVFAQLDDMRADALLKALSENESVRLLAEVARLPVLSPDDVATVMADFGAAALAYREVRQGGAAVARRRLEDRFGAARASEILSDVETVPVSEPLEYLNHVAPAQVAGFLNDEHPQVAALVLSRIDAEHAAKVVDNLDNVVATDVVRRMATMDAVPAAVVEEVARRLDTRLSAAALGVGELAAGGVTAAATVLNNVDPGSEHEVLRRIEASDPELAERIRSEMFVFADVVRLDDRALQTVLRSVDLQTSALALKGVTPDVVDKFMGNMSERTAGDFEEALQSLGPQRASAVNAAQNVLVKTARDLAEHGEIVIGRENDSFVP